MVTHASNLGDSNLEKVEQVEQKFKVNLSYMSKFEASLFYMVPYQKWRKERRDGGRKDGWMDEWMDGWMGKEKKRK